MKVIIIGGVAGGASAAARLRRLDEQAEIILLERGSYISFANCGLPYFLGDIITEEAALTLQTPESFTSRFNVQIRTNQEALAVHPAKKEVEIYDSIQDRRYTETYDALLLSPGAAPVRPPMEGIDSKRVFTLRTIPDARQIKELISTQKPRNAIVVGGGYIGLEVAENLVHAGVQTTIIELADHVIAALDADIAAEVQEYIRQKGIRLFTGDGVTRIVENEVGLTVYTKDAHLTCDLLIMGVGVRPDTKFLQDSGIELTARGAIRVDSKMRTNFPDIYAVGDAVEVTQFVTKSPAYIPLAGPANRQGRIAADAIAGQESVYEGTQGTAIVRLFDMTVATTGINEAAAKAAGISYDKTYIYAPSHAGYYPGAQNMSIKILWAADSKKILGVQIAGYEGVDKRIDVLATAMRLGADITMLKNLELSYAPPFGSAKDPVNMLGFVAENSIQGLVSQFCWDEVDSLPRDGSVTLLDVRTKAEVRRGSIPGFSNIPLDELRGHLEELPKEKPVYVHCQSGLRSYNACRILSGYGYTCYNLAGGYRLYHIIGENRAQQEEVYEH
ncbi:MAG: FAD-dependent oxidoreductase [Lachnospiraceae bacterium]